jgi:hypothetical protein
LLDDVLAQSRAKGDDLKICIRLRDRAMVSICQGHFAEARAALRESGHLGRRQGRRVLEIFALLRLAILDRMEGDFVAARSGLAEVMRFFETESVLFSLLARIELGCVARDEGRFEEARTIMLDVIAQARRRGETAAIAEMICMVAMLDIAARHALRGVRILSAVARIDGLIGTVHVPDVRHEAPLFLDRARVELGEAEYAAAWAAGSAMTLDQAVTLALEPVAEARSKPQ